MTYPEAEQYLLQHLPMFQRVGAAAYRPDLGNITALCASLGNPQKKLRCIHIGGTNGKGSVTHILAAVLQAAGYRVGVFTSPHYLTYRERIKINGEFISEDAIVDFVTKNKTRFAKVNASFFEITTAMAFQYFAQQHVDYALIEVGMGGRLDSTNIITPLLAVITNISYDHQQFLGDTLQLIAAEKAGIIKPNVPVVIGQKQLATHKIFIKKAKAVNAVITFADEVIKLQKFSLTPLGCQFLCAYFNDEKTDGKIEKYTCDLAGNYQQKNITTALCALLKLREMGENISREAVRIGLANVCSLSYFIGRWRVVQHQPMVVIDSAHNEGGWREITEQLREIKYRQLHIVFGTVSDKDLLKIFQLLPQNAHYYFCKPNIPRGKDAAQLATEAVQHGLNGNHYESVEAALQQAFRQAHKHDLVLIAGSIFVVAEILPLFPMQKNLDAK